MPLLFTENVTNHERLFPGREKNESLHVKDGINDCVVQGNQGAVNPKKQGTKVAAHCRVNIGAGQTKVIRLRLAKSPPDPKRANPLASNLMTSSLTGFVKPMSYTSRSRRPR